MKKVKLSICCLLIAATPLFSLDFNFRPKAFMFIPQGDGNIAADGNERYDTGFGVEIGFEADISSILPNPLGIGYTFGIEGAMQINPLQSDNPANISFYSAGGVIGIYFFPLSRLLIRADGAAGVNVSTSEISRVGIAGRSNPDMYWRAGGELGFRFTPGFTIAANAGWKQFNSGNNVLNSGMYAGLTAQITFGTDSGGLLEGVSARLEQTEPVYPLFMQLYQVYPAANVVLRNNENAEIRDVRVFFRAGNYTASEFLCTQVSVIPRGRAIEVPLLADFSPDILRFTDTGRLMGELVIRYRFLGREREVVRALTVLTHNRNTLPMGEPAEFAAFVSSTSNEVLEFARFIAGLERSNRRSGINVNMQYAVWLLEGLRASGIRLGETYAGETEAQYPAETLSYRTGNNRDLALLFAACLESTGKRSAFIKTENDFLAAISLGTVQEAGALANDRNTIIVDGEVWLPLSMSTFNEGYSAALTQGATILNQTFAAGKAADFVIVHDAWLIYQPAPLPELGRSTLRTDTTALTNAVNRALGR